MYACDKHDFTTMNVCLGVCVFEGGGGLYTSTHTSTCVLAGGRGPLHENEVERNPWRGSEKSCCVERKPAVLNLAQG